MLNELEFQPLLEEFCQNSVENLCLLLAYHCFRKVTKKQRQLNDFFFILSDIFELLFAVVFFNILIFCFFYIVSIALILQRPKVFHYFFD